MKCIIKGPQLLNITKNKNNNLLSIKENNSNLTDLSGNTKK